ncbi:MAG: hypothetical protein ACREX6_07785, partial [Casimicrobiaceae bacterium]
MLRWNFVFLGLAVASGLVGTIAHDARVFALAQMMFFGSVVLFIVFTLLGAVLPHPADARGAD